MDAELLTQPEEKVPRPQYLLKRGPEDEPVVQVTQDPEAITVHDGRDRGHDTREHLRGSREAEAKSAELQQGLPNLPVFPETTPDGGRRT